MKKRKVKSHELRRGEMRTGFEERCRGRKRREDRGKMIRKREE